MRRLILAIFLSSLCAPAVSQNATSDEALLIKTRALYDAPFTRDLVSFDCAVQFDWKKHFIDLLGTVPPAAVVTVERLQTVQHRVFVDRSGAVISVIPKTPDLTGAAHAVELERTFNAITSSGLNAWLPFSTNIILPVGPTKGVFQKTDAGYKLLMTGPGLTATLLLKEDLRVTSVVSELPQPMHASTEFTAGPNGFLLSSVKTGITKDPATDKEATFAFTYQTIDGFQLPSLVTVTPATTEAWQYGLTDCKTIRGAIIEVGPPTH
jgi:hypothetical protein